MIEDDYTVRLMDDLPVDGMVMESPDGHGNIYINARLSYEDQLRVCEHEVGHLCLGHLHRCGDVLQMEKEADNYRTKIKRF